MSSSLPSSSNSRSSIVHSLSGKTQGLKFMQRASLKKNQDDSSTSTSTSHPSSPVKPSNANSQDNNDSIGDISFQSSNSASNPVNESSEQWIIPTNKIQPVNQENRFQHELAWNSWHLNSQNDDQTGDEEDEKKDGRGSKEQDQDSSGFNFVSDNYKPATGKRRKRYGEWAVQRRKRPRRSDGDQDDEAENEDGSDSEGYREPLLDEGDEEERNRSKVGKKANKQSKNSAPDSGSNAKKFLKPGGSQTGIKKKISKDLLPSGARKTNPSKADTKKKSNLSSPSMGDFQAQQDERVSIREKKREKLSKGKQAKKRKEAGFLVPDMDETDDDHHFESRELDSGGL